MLESWKIYRSGEFGAESLLCPELKGDFMRYSKNSVRRAMMFALTSIGLLGVLACQSRGQIGQKRADLKDQDVTVRLAAARALGNIGPEAKEAVPDLIAALKDQDALVRGYAAGALGNIGPGAKEAVPDLRAALKDQDSFVRGSAAYALGQI